MQGAGSLLPAGSSVWPNRECMRLLSLFATISSIRVGSGLLAPSQLLWLSLLQALLLTLWLAPAFRPSGSFYGSPAPSPAHSLAPRLALRLSGSFSDSHARSPALRLALWFSASLSGPPPHSVALRLALRRSISVSGSPPCSPALLAGSRPLAQGPRRLQGEPPASLPGAGENSKFQFKNALVLFFQNRVFAPARSLVLFFENRVSAP